MEFRTGRAGLAACAAAVALAAAGAVAAPPAPGGGAPVEQANCVYDQLSDASVLAMVDTYLKQDAGGKADVERALAVAYKACAAKYGWTADRSDLAGEIALQGGVIDVVMQRMVDAGLKDDDNVLQIWNRLTEDDVGRLMADGWEKDAALSARLRKALIDGGVPDRGDMLENGVLVLVAASREAAAMDEWTHGAPKR